jgi:hypothetical protein
MVTVTQEAATMLKTKMDENKESWIRVFIRGMG